MQLAFCIPGALLSARSIVLQPPSGWMSQRGPYFADSARRSSPRAFGFVACSVRRGLYTPPGVVYACPPVIAAVVVAAREMYRRLSHTGFEACDPCQPIALEMFRCSRRAKSFVVARMKDVPQIWRRQEPRNLDLVH